MSKKPFPKSSLHDIGNSFIQMPARRSETDESDEESKIKSEESKEKSEKTVKEGKGRETQLGRQISRQLNDSAEKSVKSVKEELKSNTEDKAETGKMEKEKKPQRQYVMTYFSDANYEEFEEMLDDVKRHIRRNHNIKLKATHVAELAIMLAVEEYQNNPKSFLERIGEKALKEQK